MGKNVILETIAREMPTGVLVLNKDGRALYANPFFTSSFPADGGIEGKTVAEIINDSAMHSAVGDLLHSRATGARDIEISDDGRFFKVHMVPLKDRGEFSLLLFLSDITEEKRVETIKKDFVANVSHELRTPLASIKGYSETLLDGAVEDKETLKEFLRVIDRHATRMARLIDDLLTLSRLESHQMPIAASPMDLNDLIIGVKAGFDKQARDKGISLGALTPDSLPKVLGDRDRLEQVVVNLLDNAIKYTHPGGSVVISSRRKGADVVVEIKDTGIGIPKDDMPRIFERFYRVDKARSRELGGTGLGLAIVKHIIQGHNGRLQVESTPGKGSTFSFSLKSCP